MASLLAVPLVVALLVIAGIHVYWAAGGRWGYAVVVPTDPTRPTRSARVFEPGPGATLVVAGLLAAAALIVALAVGWLRTPAPEALPRLGVWGLAAVLLLRGVGDFRYVGLFRRVVGTRFATFDRRLFTPLCLLLAALAVGVAVSA